VITIGGIIIIIMATITTTTTTGTGRARTEEEEGEEEEGGEEGWRLVYRAWTPNIPSMRRGGIDGRHSKRWRP